MNAKSRQSRVYRSDSKHDTEQLMYKFSELDLLRFSEPRFKPESFLRSVLTSDSPDFVRHFYNVLSAEYKLAINELQRSVYANLTDFIQVNKEISRFESDLTTLRNLLNEVKAADTSQEPLRVKFTALTVYPEENALKPYSEEKCIKEDKAISEIMHELDLQIALCEYEQAVESILKVRGLIEDQESHEQCSLASARQELDVCIKKLADYICVELNNMILSKRRISENIKWMSKLGRMDEAIDTFLRARSNLIAQKSKQIRFYGDIGHYINDLSYMTVFVVMNTFEWYKYAHALANVPECLSKFVIWAQSEIETFNESFIVHIFEIKNPIVTIQECVQIALANIEKLSEIGMDLSCLFETSIRQHMEASSLSRTRSSLAPSSNQLEKDEPSETEEA